MCDTQADMDREEQSFAEMLKGMEELVAEGLVTDPTVNQKAMFTPAGRTYAAARRPLKDFMGSASVCELCNEPFKLAQIMFDAPIPHHSAWAFMCAHCYNHGRENAMKGNIFIYPKLGVAKSLIDQVLM